MALEGGDFEHIFIARNNKKALHWHGSKDVDQAHFWVIGNHQRNLNPGMIIKKHTKPRNISMQLMKITNVNSSSVDW